MKPETFRRPKVVVFDMDGTLVESSLDFLSALKRQMGFSSDSTVLEALDRGKRFKKKKDF